MPSLKACPGTGKLKAKYLNDLVYGLDRWRLSADCEECFLIYTKPRTGGTVIMDRDTYTATASGELGGSWNDFTGGLWYMAGAAIEAGALSFSWSFLGPTVANGMQYGIHITASLGDDILGDTDDGVDYWFGTDPPEFPFTWEFSCTYPVALIAEIDEWGRYNQGGTLWGPASDTVDLRGYKNAEFSYYWWPPDGKAIFSFIIGSFSGTDIEIGTGAPVLVDAGTVTQTRADVSSKLEFNLWGNEPPDNYDNNVWHLGDPSTERGVRTQVTGNKIEITRVGDTSDARNMNISATDLEPPRTIAATAKLQNLSGVEMSEALSLVPTNGPAYSPTLFDVNTNYPVEDLGAGVGADVPLNLTTNGSINRTGVRWHWEANCWLDTDAPVSIGGGLKDTIGVTDPAFGFTLSPNQLQAATYEPSAWRCPISLATWNAFEVKPTAEGILDTFDVLSWLAGPGTTLSLSGGELHLSGAGVTKAYKVFTGTEGLPLAAGRYLTFRVHGTAGTGHLEADGGKRWDFPVTDTDTEITLDMCAPTNAAGNTWISSLIQINSTANVGGWASGIWPGSQIEFALPGEGWISDLKVTLKGEDGLGVVCEAISSHDSRFYMGEFSGHAQYARRVAMFAPDGRMALDLLGGAVRRGAGVHGEDTVVALYNIDDLLIQAKAQIGVAGALRIKNLRPSNFMQFNGWTSWFWYEVTGFFHNGSESYMLEPAAYPMNEAAVVTANYGVDRVKLGMGVSLNLDILIAQGTGISGVVLDTNHAPKQRTIESDPGNHLTESGANGYYVLPLSTQHVGLEERTINGYYEGGMPLSDVQAHGITTRVSVIETS